MAKKGKNALPEEVNEMIAMLNDEKQALKAENNALRGRVASLERQLELAAATNSSKKTSSAAATLVTSTSSSNSSAASAVKPPVISSPIASLEDVNVVRKKRGRPSNSERAAMELLMQNNEDDDDRQPGKRGKTNFQFDEYWDNKLVEAVKQYIAAMSAAGAPPGTYSFDWVEIANKVGRGPKGEQGPNNNQCSRRWRSHVNPSVVAVKGDGPFTSEEDRLLMSYVETHSGQGQGKMNTSGHFVINWSGVVDALGGRRSTVECQNRYQTLRRLSAKQAAGVPVSSSSTPNKPMTKAAANATANLLTTVSSAVKAAVAGALTKGKGRK